MVHGNELLDGQVCILLSLDKLVVEHRMQLASVPDFEVLALSVKTFSWLSNYTPAASLCLFGHLQVYGKNTVTKNKAKKTKHRGTGTFLFPSNHLTEREKVLAAN